MTSHSESILLYLLGSLVIIWAFGMDLIVRHSSKKGVPQYTQRQPL